MQDFFGDKLRDARELRGKTIEQLAEEINVTRQAVSLYETGKTVPTFDRLLALAKALNFPCKFFLTPNKTNVTHGTTYFRALLKTKKADLRQLSRRAEFVSSAIEILSRYIKFPQLNLPALDSYDPIDAARALRKCWGIEGPIYNIVRLLEQNGIFTMYFNSGETDIDAFSHVCSIRERNVYIVALPQDKGSAVRIHFDVAHELGHILLHDWTESIYSLSRDEYKRREKEANTFASEFLAPAEEFNQFIPNGKVDWKQYVALKETWMVSIATILYRALGIEKISGTQYQYAIKRMQKLNIRTWEPLDDDLTTADPIILKDAVSTLLNSGEYTPDFIMDVFAENGLNLERATLEDLLGLPAGMLSRQVKDNVIQLVLRK